MPNNLDFVPQAASQANQIPFATAPQEEVKAPDSAPSDPNLAVLASVKSRLSLEHYDFYVNRLNDNCKKTVMAIKSYNKSKDVDDLINSLQRLYTKLKK